MRSLLLILLFTLTMTNIEAALLIYRAPRVDSVSTSASKFLKIFKPQVLDQIDKIGKVDQIDLHHFNKKVENDTFGKILKDFFKSSIEGLYKVGLRLYK